MSFFASYILKVENNFLDLFVSWILSLKTNVIFLTESTEIYVDIFKNSTVQIIIVSHEAKVTSSVEEPEPGDEPFWRDSEPVKKVQLPGVGSRAFL